MNVGSLKIWRGKRIFFTLIALICATLVICAWEGTPLSTFFPNMDQFDIHKDLLSPDAGTLVETPLIQSYPDQQPSLDFSDVDGLGSPTAYNAKEVFGVPPTDSSMQSLIENTKVDKIYIAKEVISVTPISSSIQNSAESTEIDEGLKMPPENKECNYAKGKWIADKRRPLYSGYGCKQWLSGMWACRLMQRTDFSYEGFRWKPNNCEMPDFQGSKFLRKMKHKTIALVGDSLGRQQFQSLMCMVTGGKESPEVQDVGKEYGLVKARGSIRPDGWAYRFPRTNTTILYYWSASLCELEPLNRSDPTTSYAMHLDRPATFLSRYLHRFDVLVLNTGHHWNRGKLKANRWEMYVGGMPNTNKKFADIASAKNLTVYSVVKWLNSQLPQYPKLKAFLRTMSPRHFVNGDWNSGGSCDSTTPLAGGSEVLQDGSSDTVSEGAAKGTRVKLLDITALSQLRDEGHISKYSAKASEGVHDCLHWCLPGIPDTWNEILFARI